MIANKKLFADIKQGLVIGGDCHQIYYKDDSFYTQSRNNGDAYKAQNFEHTLSFLKQKS